MAKIKLSQKNEASQNADGYLVQYKFKNGFKDFRIGDCMFVKDLQSLGTLVKSKDDLTSAAFVIEERNRSRTREILQAISDMGYDHATQPWGETVYLAKSIKAWALQDGTQVPSGVSYYISPDGTVMAKAEYSAYLDRVIAALEKKLGFEINVRVL